MRPGKILASLHTTEKPDYVLHFYYCLISWELEGYLAMMGGQPGGLAKTHHKDTGLGWDWTRINYRLIHVGWQSFLHSKELLSTCETGLPCFWRSRTVVCGWCGRNVWLESSEATKEENPPITFQKVLCSPGQGRFCKASWKLLALAHACERRRPQGCAQSHLPPDDPTSLLTTSPPSCRTVSLLVPWGPRNACTCNWWRPSLCSCSLSLGGYL